MLRQYQNPAIVGSSILKYLSYKSDLENLLIGKKKITNKNEISDQCNFHPSIFFIFSYFITKIE